MKIAVLNESFLLDTHIQQLKQFGEVVKYDSTDSEEKAIERLKDVHPDVSNQLWVLTLSICSSIIDLRSSV